jgi:hypothetical protein
VVTLAGALAAGLSLADDADVQKAQFWVGVVFARAVDWEMNPMLLVKEIIPGSPADAAGVIQGDFISAFNGSPIRDYAALPELLHSSAAGDVVVFTIRRGAELLAAPVTLTVPTDAQRDNLSERFRALAAVAQDADEPHMAYIPQRLCLYGVTFAEAFAMSYVPGAVSMDVSDLGTCRHPVAACAPVILSKQTKQKTVVARQGVKYKLKGDWRAITYDDRERCLAAISQRP